MLNQRTLTVLVCWLALACPALAADPLRPNIVFILADDLGYVCWLSQDHLHFQTSCSR